LLFAIQSKRGFRLTPWLHYEWVNHPTAAAARLAVLRAAAEDGRYFRLVRLRVQVVRPDTLKPLHLTRSDDDD